MKKLNIILTLYICFVFIQSLFFKFAGSTETEFIFTTLDDWAGSLGFSGLFLPPGIFNQYVIGSVELGASIFLLIGCFGKCKFFLPLGALISFAVISGAIFFHLFTPLGIEIMGDSGTLFIMACGIWISSIILIYRNKSYLCCKSCPRIKEKQ